MKFIIGIMAITITPTEFNRKRSRVLQTASSGQDVIVRQRNTISGGVLITRLDKPMSAITAAIASGLLNPPKKSMDEPFRAVAVDAERARIALDEFESERVA